MHELIYPRLSWHLIQKQILQDILKDTLWQVVDSETNSSVQDCILIVLFKLFNVNAAHKVIAILSI